MSLSRDRLPSSKYKTVADAIKNAIESAKKTIKGEEEDFKNGLFEENGELFVYEILRASNIDTKDLHYASQVNEYLQLLYRDIS